MEIFFILKFRICGSHSKCYACGWAAMAHVHRKMEDILFKILEILAKIITFYYYLQNVSDWNDWHE